MSRLDTLITGVNLSEILALIKPITTKYRNTTVLNKCFNPDEANRGWYIVRPEVLKCLDSPY